MRTVQILLPRKGLWITSYDCHYMYLKRHLRICLNCQLNWLIMAVCFELHQLLLLHIVGYKFNNIISFVH